MAVAVFDGSLSEVARSVTVPVGAAPAAAAAWTTTLVVVPNVVVASALGSTTRYPVPLTVADSRYTSEVRKARTSSGWPAPLPAALPVLVNGNVHVAPAVALPVAVPAASATPRGWGPRPSSDRMPIRYDTTPLAETLREIT